MALIINFVLSNAQLVDLDLIEYVLLLLNENVTLSALDLCQCYILGFIFFSFAEFSRRSVCKPIRGGPGGERGALVSLILENDLVFSLHLCLYRGLEDELAMFDDVRQVQHIIQIFFENLLIVL